MCSLDQLCMARSELHKNHMCKMSGPTCAPTNFWLSSKPPDKPSRGFGIIILVTLETPLVIFPKDLLSL